MIEAKTKTIKGREVIVTQWGAITGLRMGTRLVKLLGPGLAKAFMGGGGLASMLEKDTNEFGAAIMELLNQLDESATPDQIFSFFSQTTVDRQDMSNLTQFNLAFAAKYLDLFAVLAFIIEVNFADFFAALGPGKDIGSLIALLSAGNDQGK